MATVTSICESTLKVTEPRPGKRVGVLRIHLQQQHKGKTYQFMRVMRAVERTIDKKGQTSAFRF